MTEIFVEEALYYEIHEIDTSQYVPVDKILQPKLVESMLTENADKLLNSPLFEQLQLIFLN